MPDPTPISPPAIPGYRLTIGPAVSVFGSGGYLVYECLSTAGAGGTPVPPGFEIWPTSRATIFGDNPLVIRPVKVAPPVTPPPVVVVPPGVPPPKPLGPTDGILVASGGDVNAALKAAKPNAKIYLAAGGTYAAVDSMGTRAAGLTLTVWGTGPRPIIRSDRGQTGLSLWATDGFTVDGIAFVGNGNPAVDSAGIDARGCKALTVVRCEVTAHRMGITAQPAGDRRCDGVKIDANYIHDNAPGTAGGDSSGVFCGACDNVVVTNNVFDHNGWSDTFAGTIRNHNFYCRADCSPPIVTGNIFSRASSHGMQARAGGVITGNTFIDNAIHMSFGLVNGGGPVHVGGASGKISGNTFSGTRPLAGSPRGWAIEASNVLDLAITNNVMASDFPYDPHTGLQAAAVKLDVCNLDPTVPDRDKVLGVKRIVIDGNAITWPFARVWANPGLHVLAVETHPLSADVAATRAAAMAGLAARVAVLQAA